MADFRKSLLLAAMTLTFGVGMASAQSEGTCAATTGVPPSLRAEGEAELTGVIVLACQALPADVTVNFDITLNNGTVPITSRLGGGEGKLSVNGATVAAGATVTLTGSATPNNDIRFTGVTVPAGNSTIIFSGIRAWVNTYVPINTGGFGQVLAVMSVSGGSLPISQVNQGFFVGIVLPGLGATTITGPTLNACAGSISLTSGNNFTISIPENFPTAFKTQGPATTDNETGTTPGALFASSATQFAVSLASIPSGVTFYVPITITSSAGGTAILVTQEGGNVMATATDTTTFGTSVVALTEATNVFYNVISSSPSVQETFTLPVYNSAGTFSSSTSLGTTATVNLAPLAGDGFTPGPTGQWAPSFVGGAAPASFTSSSTSCQTSLLFTFLTNEAGFDTGISIAATGTDPFNTNIAGGTCTLYLYGNNGPSAGWPTLTVPSGGEAHTTISAVAPNFQGYGIAVCDFTYAHGYAFITDGFMGPGKGLSEGYTANVINDRANASSSVNTTLSTPEELSN